MSLYVKKGSFAIAAGTNSITVTHNLGYSPTGEGIACENDEASILKIVNKTATQMDIALPAGMLAGAEIVGSWIAS